MAGTITRAQWEEMMEDTLYDTFTSALEDENDWKKAFHEVKATKRREEMLEYALPAPVVKTPEGSPYVRLKTDKIRSAAVIIDDYTGEERVSHQMQRDKFYNEIEQKSWGLGESVNRRLYEDACALIFNGFSSTVTPDNAAWFATHTLSKSSSTYSNLVTGTFGADAIDNLQVNMMECLNERGAVTPYGSKHLRVFVPAKLRRKAKQLAMPGQYEAGKSDFDINVFDYEPVCLPLLAAAPSDYRATQYYACDPSKMQTYFFLREGPIFKTYIDEDTDDVVIKVRIAYAFLVASWRGWAGSQG